LRLHVLPPIAKHLFSLDAVRKLAFPVISQIGINYRHGSLSNHAGDEDFEVKAGDRMPYIPTDGHSIYEKLSQPKFHWLVFSNEPKTLPDMSDELGNPCPELINFNAFSISPEVSAAFGRNEDFSVLLRPDNHLGLISTDISPGSVGKYLTEFIGLLNREN